MEIPTRCFQCGGVYHESTGDYDRKWNIVFCGPCITSFYKWLKGHMKRKWGGANFYEEAHTSIKATSSSKGLESPNLEAVVELTVKKVRWF